MLSRSFRPSCTGRALPVHGPLCGAQLCTWSYLTRIGATRAICGATLVPCMWMIILSRRSRRIRPFHPPLTLPRSGATSTLLGIRTRGSLLPMATPLNMPPHPLHAIIWTLATFSWLQEPGTIPCHPLPSLPQPAVKSSRKAWTAQTARRGAASRIELGASCGARKTLTSMPSA